MLKKVSKKSMLLFGAALALCAFAMPSMASAASWSPVGTSDGVIDSSNIGFSQSTLNSGSFCRNTTFRVTVDSASVATITNAAFQNCHGLAGLAAQGCTVTASGTNFPWVATAVTTSNIQIHGVNIDVRFETTPPAGSVPCANNGVQLTLTGTLSGVTYTPASKTYGFAGSTGLFVHVHGVAAGLPAAVQGTATGTGLLNVFD